MHSVCLVHKAARLSPGSPAPARVRLQVRCPPRSPSGPRGPAPPPPMPKVAPEEGAAETAPLQTALSPVGSVLGDAGEDDDCDPYLKISIPSLRQTKHTKHKTHDRNPDWGEQLTFHGVTGRTELLDITCMDHDVMSKDDKLGRATFRTADLTTGVPWEGWLELDDVATGRIQLEMLLQMDGTLNVTCICGRDLQVQTRWKAKKRAFRATGLNIRDAWELDGDAGIPDQSSLPLHPDMPVCARLVTDGYCLFGENCQFHHPEQIRRKPRPPPKDRRLEIKQGFWGYLRDGSVDDGSQIDVTAMLKDIVIEQEGIQLELPKKMKHLLWRKGVMQPGGGAAESSKLAVLADNADNDEEEEDGGGDADADEGGGGEDDPDAPERTLLNQICDRVLFWREPVYGLKIWYYVKGKKEMIRSWRADEWVYIESYQEMRKRQRKNAVKFACCTLFWFSIVMVGFWLYFIMAGMGCSGAEYSQCFDKNDVYMDICEMQFQFPTHEIGHIDVSNVRGSISISSVASSPNISVTIRQTVLEEGAMAGLTSNAELVDGTLSIYSRWNNSHHSEFPDMYGGPVSMFNCPSSEIVIALPATADTTQYGSLFTPSLSAHMDEPVYECSFKNPQACWYGFMIMTSIELKSKIEVLMGGNDTLAWPAGAGTAAFPSTGTPWQPRLFCAVPSPCACCSQNPSRG